MPEKGPYIVWYTEPGLIALFVAWYITTKLLGKGRYQEGGSNVMAFFQEELFRVKYIQQGMKTSPVELRGLVPHSAPGLAKGMLDGYRLLLNHGVVVHNPQGDATWDGRPTAFGRILVWLGLRTAAPILPSLITIGSYDIWPRWMFLPSLRGKMRLVFGKPFTLTDKPLDRVTDEDMAQAQAIVSEHFERIHYGPDGVAGWQGPVLRDGVEVTEPVQLLPPSTPLATVSPAKTSVSRQGVAQLLWQCPVCRTNDALVHRRPLLRRETVICQACGTLWSFQRQMGRDFRMMVLEGPPEVKGLEMAVSAWYEHMNKNFSPYPIKATGVQLLPGEEVYLEACDVPLSPYQPNALFDGWTQREAPKKQADWLKIAGWEFFGEGRLLVTSHRVLWQGTEREIDFMWSEMTAVSQYLRSTLALHYGAAKYRLSVNGQPILKWLHTMGELAKEAGAHQGRTVGVTHH